MKPITEASQSSLADVRPKPHQSICRFIDWFSEGEARTVELNEIQVVVRFVGRKGRRGRIAMEVRSEAIGRS